MLYELHPLLHHQASGEFCSEKLFARSRFPRTNRSDICKWSAGRQLISGVNVATLTVKTGNKKNQLSHHTCHNWDLHLKGALFAHIPSLRSLPLAILCALPLSGWRTSQRDMLKSTTKVSCLLRVNYRFSKAVCAVGCPPDVPFQKS